MPPAVAAAAVTGAAAIGGGVLQSRANNSAQRSQEKGAAAALDYQERKDAQDRADKERDRALAKAAWDASESERIARQAPRRAAIASLYRDRGISLPAVTARQYDPTGVANAEAPSSAQQPVSLLSLYGGGMPAQQAPLTPALPGADAEMTLADFFGRRQTNLS